MQAKIRDSKQRMRVARQVRVVKRLGRARSQRPRLTVYRSNKHIYALLVDPLTGRTLASVSSLSKILPEVESEATGKVALAEKVGTAIANLARERQIDEVVFNRNGFLYHGRVKALADAARKGGLRF